MKTLSDQPSAVEDILAACCARRAQTRWEGDLAATTFFTYPKDQEARRLDLTEAVARRMVTSGPDDPTLLESLARQIASIEGCLIDLSDEEGPVYDPQRLLFTLLPTGHFHRISKRTFAEANPEDDVAMFAVSAGHVLLTYALARLTPRIWTVEGSLDRPDVVFQNDPDSVYEVLSTSDVFADDLVQILDTTLSDGLARSSLARPETAYQAPISALVSLSERFVLAHELGHCCLDYGLIRGAPWFSGPDFQDSTEERWLLEHQMDAFAAEAVVRSGSVFDARTPEFSLQGAFFAAAVEMVVEEVFSVANGVAPLDLTTHPPPEERVRPLIAYLDGRLRSFYRDEFEDESALSAHVERCINFSMTPARTLGQLWESSRDRVLTTASQIPVHPVWTNAGKL